MSSFQAFSLAKTPSTSSSNSAPKHAASPLAPGPSQTQPSEASPLTVSPSSAVPTGSHQKDFSPIVATPRSSRKRPTHVSLSAEEEVIAARVADRVASYLASDQVSVLFPDVDTPFESPEDAVNRLLPYHIFQVPKEDLGKGKRKASEEELLKEELADTKFALECFKRRRALEDRFRRARIKSGKRTAPDDQAYFLAQAVLEVDRAETAALTAEARTAKADLERIEREKRIAAMPPRPAYYAAPPQTPVYAHHYRTYQYPYATPTSNASTSTQGYPHSMPVTPIINQYVPPTPATPTPAATSGIATPTTSFSTVPLTGAIPVQLPVSSLPTLHALGIVPVPASSLPPASSDQPPPPAVLRGSSANGSMLSLEINVSLLQAAQMSGLALVLNSIMRGSSGEGNANGAASPAVVPPYAQIGAPYTYPYVHPQTPQPLAGLGSAPRPATVAPNGSTSDTVQSGQPPGSGG